MIKKHVVEWEQTDLELTSWLLEARSFMKQRNDTPHLVWLSTDFLKPSDAAEPIALWLKTGAVLQPTKEQIEGLSQRGSSVGLRGVMEWVNLRALIDGAEPSAA